MMWTIDEIPEWIFKMAKTSCDDTWLRVLFGIALNLKEKRPVMIWRREK